MSEETDSYISTIYVPLLDEGVDVLRPTRAIKLGAHAYRLLPTPDYDPDDECWQFTPGSVVHVGEETIDGHVVLVARQLLSPNGTSSALSPIPTRTEPG